MKNRSVYVEKIKKNRELTSFQKRVLTVILMIPEGEVRTYAWAAAKAGSPGASRAAGRALSKNPYAPFVPCHRVIRSDGSLGGYSGRKYSKQGLLESEGITLKKKKNGIYIDNKDGKK